MKIFNKIILIALALFIFGNMDNVDARTLKITKEPTEETELSLEGAIFAVYNAQTDAFFGTFTSDENGVVMVPGLSTKYGYYFFEVQPPKGFYRKDSVARFTEGNNDPRSSSICFPIKKTITITNEWGAEFQIISKKSNKVLDTLVVNETGDASVELQYGTYIIKQTKANDDTKLQELEITIDDDTSDREIVNIKPTLKTGSINIQNIDVMTNEVVNSVLHFKIRNLSTNEDLVVNGNSIFELVFGSISIEDVPYGDYEIYDIRDNTGYEIKNLSLEFSVNESSEDVLMELLAQSIEETLESEDNTNESILDEVNNGSLDNEAEVEQIVNNILLGDREEIVVPITSENKSIFLLSFSFMLGLFGLFVYEKQKKMV